MRQSLHLEGNAACSVSAVLKNEIEKINKFKKQIRNNMI
jgi:hypothetical protein